MLGRVVENRLQHHRGERLSTAGNISDLVDDSGRMVRSFSAETQAHVETVVQVDERTTREAQEYLSGIARKFFTPSTETVVLVGNDAAREIKEDMAIPSLVHGGHPERSRKKGGERTDRGWSSDS